MVNWLLNAKASASDDGEKSLEELIEIEAENVFRHLAIKEITESSPDYDISSTYSLVLTVQKVNSVLQSLILGKIFEERIIFILSGSCEGNMWLKILACCPFTANSGFSLELLITGVCSFEGGH